MSLTTKQSTVLKFCQENGGITKAQAMELINMRYIVFFAGQSPFYTQWFDAENLFVIGMTVIDTETQRYTIDGTNWIEMQIDHL